MSKYRIEGDDVNGWTLYADDTAIFHTETIDGLCELERLIAAMIDNKPDI